jgi:polysaccharide export outer membrane protein/exopolysaccharide production protein ExoF
VKQEKLIFATREEALKLQTESLEQLKRYLARELDSIKAQIGHQEKFLVMAQQDKRHVESHYTSRVVTEQRFLAAQRDLANAEGETLRLKSRLVGLNHELSKVETSLLEARSKFRGEVLAELTSTNARLEQIGHKITTGRNLVSQSERMAPRWASARLGFTIVRHDGLRFAELPASETTAVAPGDTIKVKCCGDPLEASYPDRPAHALSLRSRENASE